MINLDVTIREGIAGQPTDEKISLDLYLESSLFSPYPLAFTSLYPPPTLSDGSILSISPVRYIHIFDPSKKSIVICNSELFGIEKESAFRFIYNSYSTRNVYGLHAFKEHVLALERKHLSFSNVYPSDSFRSSVAVQSKSISSLLFNPSCVEDFEDSINISGMLQIPSVMTMPAFFNNISVTAFNCLSPESIEASSTPSIGGENVFVAKKTLDADVTSFLDNKLFYLVFDVTISKAHHRSKLTLKMCSYDTEGFCGATYLVKDEPCYVAPLNS